MVSGCKRLNDSCAGDDATFCQITLTTCYYYNFYLPAVAYDPEMLQKLGRLQHLQKVFIWNGLPSCQQSSHEVKLRCNSESACSNAQPLNFTYSFCDSSTKTRKKSGCQTVNWAECFHRNRPEQVTTFQLTVLCYLASCYMLWHRACILRFSLHS